MLPRFIGIKGANEVFFCCLPSLAMYLVAQYAGYGMRKMKAEHEAKRKAKEEAEEKAREEEKAKETEMRASITDISTVIGRLDALEGVVKEIAGEKKKSDTEVNPNASEVVASNKQNGATNGTTLVCSNDSKSSNRIAKD